MRLGSTTIVLLGALGACTKTPDATESQPTPAAVAAPAAEPSPSAIEDEPEAQPLTAPEEPEEPEASDTTSAEEKDTPPPAVSGPTFSVIARLVDAGKSVPHCGRMHFKVVMKYAVLEVVDGAFEPAILYAAVSCPEMPPTKARGFAWTVGETYRLKLRTAGVRRQGAKVDAFEDEPGKRYELLHIDPVPAP